MRNEGTQNAVASGQVLVMDCIYHYELFCVRCSQAA